MFFVILIGGILFVRLMAFLLSPDRCVNKWLRIFIATALGVGIGLLPLVMVDKLILFTEGRGEIMTILNGLGIIPAIMGVGSGVTLVSVAAAGEGSTWIEYFRDEKYSYGRETGPLPLIAMIAFAVIFSGFIYLLIYGFSLPVAMGLYYIVQFVGFIMACKGDK